MHRFLIIAALLSAAAVATAGLLQGGAEGDLERGQELARQGDIAGALAAYEKVIEARPAWPDGHVYLGGMQLMDQRYKDAVLSFQKAISLGAASRRPFIGMGMAYLHMGQFGPARAAFSEAKARSSEPSGEIDKILAWLDAQDSAAPPPVHP